jgi:hypothetical protein
VIASVPVAPRPSVTRGAPKVKRPSAQAVTQTLRQRKLTRVLDRGVLFAIAGVIVASAAVYAARSHAGLSSDVTLRKLTSAEMPALSPLIVAGELRTRGDDQALHGWISGTRWRQLTPDARRDAADELARATVAAGIDSAELLDHTVPVISIRQGVVISAVGAAP